MDDWSLMGIVNITPDSFSDGGLYTTPQEALKRIQKLIELEVDWIDIGAESSRPGAIPLTSIEEQNRLEPLFESLKKLGISFASISVDTYHPETMTWAASYGVGMINCIKGVPDNSTLIRLKELNPSIHFCAMHLKGTPDTMQEKPLTSKEVAFSVEKSFSYFQNTLLDAGFLKSEIWLDPGIGFGKSDGANLKIIEMASKWSKTYQLLYGISRKSFLGRTLDIQKPEDRDLPSKTLELGLWCQGVRGIRTHSVEPLIRFKNLRM